MSLQASPKLVKGYFYFSLFHLSLGLLFLLLSPYTLSPEMGGQRLPTITHLFTLGFLAGSILYLGYQRLDHPLVWRWLEKPIFVFYHLGLWIFLVGFWRADTFLIYLGGHYIAPTALYFFMGQIMLSLIKSPIKKHRKGQIPWAAGLFIAITLGGFLALEIFYGKYGIFHTGWLLPHVISAIGLFTLPFWLNQQNKRESQWVPFSLALSAAILAGYGATTEHETIFQSALGLLIFLSLLVIIKIKRNPIFRPAFSSITLLVGGLGWALLTGGNSSLMMSIVLVTILGILVPLYLIEIRKELELKPSIFQWAWPIGAFLAGIGPLIQSPWPIKAGALICLFGIHPLIKKLKEA